MDSKERDKFAADRMAAVISLFVQLLDENIDATKVEFSYHGVEYIVQFGKVDELFIADVAPNETKI